MVSRAAAHRAPRGGCGTSAVQTALDVGEEPRCARYGSTPAGKCSRVRLGASACRPRPRRLCRCRCRRRLHRRRRRHRCRRRSRLRRSGCQKPAPRPLNAEPRGRRARATAEPPLMPIACARALRVPRRCLGCSRRCLRFVRLCATKKPVHIAEEPGERLQEQGVEHVGQRQAFCNREKGGTARMVFARRLRLLHARSRCSAMNIIMLQVGCRSACTKINAWCCARWRARMGA